VESASYYLVVGQFEKPHRPDVWRKVNTRKVNTKDYDSVEISTTAGEVVNSRIAIIRIATSRVVGGVAWC
jgi:hypothetical protein